MKRMVILLLAVSVFSTSSFAQETARFSSQELSAALTLMHTELNSVELNGRKGVFDPAPALKFLGVEREEFAVDLGWASDIADLSFNHLKAKAPSIQFVSNALKISVEIEDQSRAVQSALGSISFKGVVVSALVGWKTKTNGEQELALFSSQFNGNLSGSGVLRSNFVLNRVKQLMLKALNGQISKLLSKPKIQVATYQGLLGWSKFSVGHELSTIIPGSIHFVNDGIQYNIE